MNEPALSAEQLMAWVEKTHAKWRDLIAANPQILQLPCDIMNVGTVAALLQHIVAAEVRYAERIAGLPQTEYTTVPCDSAEAIYATHTRAFQILRSQLASDVNWDEWIEFQTRSAGMMRSTRKTIFFHLLFHSIRHYAQLATLVRQQGINPGWMMDYLAMQVERM